MRKSIGRILVVMVLASMVSFATPRKAEAIRVLKKAYVNNYDTEDPDPW